MRNFISALGLVLFAASTNAAHPKIVKVVKGVSWMSALPNKIFPNGCTDEQGIIAPEKCAYQQDQDGKPVKVDGYPQVDLANSNAAKACAAIGARLPTQWEYQYLIESYTGLYTDSGSGLGPVLTSEGIAAMQKEFGDMVPASFANWFWTSSTYGIDKALIFSSHYGSTYMNRYRDLQGWVRCVR